MQRFYSCLDNEAPVFQDCPQKPIIVRRGEPLNITEPSAMDNSGGIARLDIKPQSFKIPFTIFHDMVVKYTAFDYDGNVAICEFNITIAGILSGPHLTLLNGLEVGNGTFFRSESFFSERNFSKSY